MEFALSGRVILFQYTVGRTRDIKSIQPVVMRKEGFTVVKYNMLHVIHSFCRSRSFQMTHSGQLYSLNIAA